METLDWRTLFSPYVRSLPRFSALADAILAQVSDLAEVAQSLPAAFSLETAEGRQLDLLAESLGLRRGDLAADPATVPDATFRAWIRARLACWRWDGTNEGMPAALREAFPDHEVSCVDNGDLTVSVSGLPPELPADSIVPVPAGVRII